MLQLHINCYFYFSNIFLISLTIMPPSTMFSVLMVSLRSLMSRVTRTKVELETV